MDLEKEVIDLKEEVAGLKRDVSNLNGWQATQNGALLRLDAKVDNLMKWIIGLLGTSLLSLLLLVLNLMVKKGGGQ